MTHAVGPAPRSIGALVAVAMHATAALALLSYEPARSAVFSAAPIMVELITLPKAQPKPEPPVEILPPRPKPKPKPVVKRQPKPPEPSRVLAAPVEAPAPVVAAPPPPEPQPEPEPAPSPVVPVIPPVFNADYLRNPPPAYPALSRRIGEEGRVLLRVLVSPAGTAEEVQVRTSSGSARLDQAARDAVQRWKFVPARRGEHPVAAWVLIPISFRLEG
jgi:protein TonB